MSKSCQLVCTPPPVYSARIQQHKKEIRQIAAGPCDLPLIVEDCRTSGERQGSLVQTERKNGSRIVQQLGVRVQEKQELSGRVLRTEIARAAEADIFVRPEL